MGDLRHRTIPPVDWARFNRLLRDKCKIINNEGFLDRKGHHLYLELKPIQDPPWRFTDWGQWRALMSLAQDKGDTVVVFTGRQNENNEIEEVQEMYVLLPGGRVIPFQPATIEGLERFISAWFNWADVTPRYIVTIPNAPELPLGPYND